MSKQITEYSLVVSTVSAAIKGDEGQKGKWEKVAQVVSGFYGSETAITEQKAQFIADCILPAIDRKHAEALKVDLPRKNGTEYKGKVASDSSYPAKWEAADTAKRAARATCDTYFARVLKYAFPKPKVEGESKPDQTKTDPITKVIESINDAIKAIQKMEKPGFDPVKAIEGLQASLAIVSAKPA